MQGDPLFSDSFDSISNFHVSSGFLTQGYFFGVFQLLGKTKIWDLEPKFKFSIHCYTLFFEILANHSGLNPFCSTK